MSMEVGRQERDMKRSLLKRFKSKRGQTSVEYILIIVIIVAAVFAFGKQLKSGITSATDELFKTINSRISSTAGGD